MGLTALALMGGLPTAAAAPSDDMAAMQTEIRKLTSRLAALEGQLAAAKENKQPRKKEGEEAKAGDGMVGIDENRLYVR